MQATRDYLTSLGLPPGDAFGLPTSTKRFPDGAQCRIEIPSVEGPEALAVVLDAAAARDVPVHRVSQGSGMMLLTDDEISRMLELGRSAAAEVCLFVGPRASWDVGVQAVSSSGRVLGASLRGGEGLVHGIEDVRRGCELGVRSILVADLGQLSVLGRMKASGDLPEDLVLKVSISLAVANPATARVLEDLGANSLNLPVDLTLPQVAAMRAAVDVPLDLYIEGPDDFGSPLRYYELPELVRVGAPLYVKFTVRNAAGQYPAGQHLRSAVLALSAERVRRAEIGLALLRRHYPDVVLLPARPA